MRLLGVQSAGRTALSRNIGQLGLLGVSQAGIALAAFGTQVLLARSLSQAQFGAFMTVLSLVTLTAPLAVFGVAEFWLQRFGGEGHRAYRWFRPSVILVVLCAAVVTDALLLWGALGYGDPVTAKIRTALAPMVLAQAAIALASSALQLRGSYGQLALVQTALPVGRLLVAGATWWFGLPVLAAALGFTISAFLSVLLGCLVTWSFWRGNSVLVGHGPATANRPARPPILRDVAGRAAPFMFGGLFYLLGMHLGIVVSGELLGPEAAAILAVPMAVLAATYLLPRVVYQQYFLAKLHRWSRFDEEAFLAAYRVGTPGMLAVGAVLAIIVAAGGWYAVPLLFGSAYRTSVPVLAVLSLAIPLRFGAASLASLLTSGKLLRRKAGYQAVGAVAFVAGLAVAIPTYGVPGAAVATVLSEAVLLVLFWYCVRRYVVAGKELPSWTAVRRRLVEAPGAR